MSEQEILDFAERFLHAIQIGDVATMRACYAPDAKIWHNTDDAEQSRDDNAVTLKGFVFVWMGAGEPMPMQEDIPLRMTSKKTFVPNSAQSRTVQARRTVIPAVTIIAGCPS